MPSFPQPHPDNPQTLLPGFPPTPRSPLLSGVSLLPGEGGSGLWFRSEGCLEAPGAAGNSLPLRPPSLPGSAAPGSLRPAPPLRRWGRRAGRSRARGRGEPVPHGWVPKAQRGPGAGRAPARRRRPCPAPTRGTPAEPGARRRGDVGSRGPRPGLRAEGRAVGATRVLERTLGGSQGVLGRWPGVRAWMGALVLAA